MRRVRDDDLRLPRGSQHDLEWCVRVPAQNVATARRRARPCGSPIDLGNFPGNYGNFPRSEFDADAPQRLDGFAEWEINAHWYGGEFPRGRPTPTHLWYGEHDAPHGPLNDGDAAPDWLAGGVGACYNDRAFYSLSCVYDGTCPVQFEDQLIDPEVDATADDPTIDWATSTTNFHPDEPPAWTVNPESSWSTDQWRRALFGGGGGAPASGAPPAFGAPPLDDDPWAAARAARDATWDAAASGYSWGDDGGGGGSGKDPWAHIRSR